MYICVKSEIPAQLTTASNRPNVCWHCSRALETSSSEVTLPLIGKTLFDSNLVSVLVSKAMTPFAPKLINRSTVALPKPKTLEPLFSYII